MNTDLLFRLKRELQILVEQMKTIFSPQDGLKQYAYEILQFKVPLKNIQSQLQAEQQNHASFGDLDQLEILWADEQKKQKWHQKRDNQEQLLERLLIHDHLLLCFCDFIRYNPDLDRLSLTSLLYHLLEFIAIDIRRYTHFPHLAIAYEGIENLTADIKKFINRLRKQLNRVEAQKQKRVFDLLLELEEYQFIIQPQAQLFSQEKAKLEHQKHQWYQEQDELKRQHQAWLEEQKAELRQQQASLEEQKAELRQQQARLEAEKIKLQREQVLLQSKTQLLSTEQPNRKNNRRLRWSPLLLLAFVIGILGGVQILPKVSVSSQKNLSSLAQNQPLELRLKSAQVLAREASQAVENKQSLPLTAWQEAQGKWKDAITVLQQMPDRQVHSEPVQKQLAIYREDYNWASQNLIREQTAIANFNSAKKTALKASVLVQKTALPLDVWQQAHQKWQRAINLLETIPDDTFIAPQVQDKIIFYRLNAQEIEKRIYMEKQADQQRRTQT